MGLKREISFEIKGDEIRTRKQNVGRSRGCPAFWKASRRLGGNKEEETRRLKEALGVCVFV